MENLLKLVVLRQNGCEDLTFDVKRLWNGGWAGKNQAEVQKHIDELAQHGIPGPTTVPIYFPLSNNLLTTTGQIQVVGPESSGEVEYVLLFDRDATYVGVASDHTDRTFEVHGIKESKQMYPNVLAPEVWPLEEVQDHWDALRLRCWVTSDGQRQLYQEAVLAEMLSPEEWQERLRSAGVVQPGTAFLSGTPPTLPGLVFGDRYEIELEDPVLGRSIRHGYDVELLPAGVL